MGERPEEIRREIDATRDRMGDTVEAIGYKADVPSRAKEKVAQQKEKLAQQKDRLAGAARRQRGQVSSGTSGRAQQATSLAEENPLGLAIGAAAAGFLLGMVIPSTRVEDERVGPLSDEVKGMAKETGQEVFERGKQVATETAQSARETVKGRAQEEGEQLSSSTRSRAEDISGDYPSGTTGSQ
jgi:ElaB/YqjD/DUF883 family membrane-anchored ribosome-binding protein